MARKLKVQKKKAQKKSEKKMWLIIGICVAVALIAAIVIGIVSFKVNYLDGNGTTTDAEESENVTFGAEEPDLTVTNRVEISVANYGIMKAELYGNEAPISVENFMSYVNSGFYEGVTFHRVVEDFMIQAGISYTTETNGYIKGEFALNGVKNNIPHERGTISMARATACDTASSQFFIVHQTSEKNSSALDGRYAAFGKVYEGLDVLDAIAAVECGYSSSGEQSAPYETITIEYIKEITD